jgi:site-specific recombinase XerD
LDFCQSDHAGQATLLAGQSDEAVHTACRKTAVIHKRIGWHTFRHTFGTLLKANGEDVKTVQELLRHATSRITLEVYTQAVTWQKRPRRTKVVRMMVPGMGERAKSA